jgi:hypothetical protein
MVASISPQFIKTGYRGKFMKQSILGLVCASIALAIGTADPVAAASLSGGHNLGGINYTCSSSGAGSGFLNEGSAGCAEYVSSGSFQMSGSGQASYDSLRASASVGMSSLDPSGFVGTNGLLLSALGQATSNDKLTIDIPGRTGELVDLVFETRMSGSLSASADYTDVYAVADSVLSVLVNGYRVNVGQSSNNSGTPPTLSDGNPGRVQIQLGTPFNVSSQLTVKARLGRTSGSATFFSGDAVANFANTAGITSIMLFESGTGGALIPAWNLASESGQFGYYTPVPAPATIWLLAPALGLLASRVKRKNKA